MYRLFYTALFLCLVLVASCVGSGQFSEYRRVDFGVIGVGDKVMKVIEITNDSGVDQHLLAVGFDPGTNDEGNFALSTIRVGGKVVEGDEFTIPAGSSIVLEVTYSPREYIETSASYGGWKTGKDALGGGKVEDSEEKVQRAVIVLVYDTPQEGIVHIETIGKVLPADEATTTSVDTVKSNAVFSIEECTIDVPGLLPNGAMPLESIGDLSFSVEGDAVTIDMTQFPTLFVVLRGNAPGEPLEGQPVATATLIVSGKEGVVATGVFDGERLEVNGLAFVVRIVVGELKKEQIKPGLPSAINFDIDGVKLTTVAPFDGEGITLKVEHVLQENPSGIPAFDEKLGGKTVTIAMKGVLTLD